MGYENHSGQTYLSATVKPFARVKKGVGNNFVGDYEGARYKNVIGTYLHGALLPKNPAITDWLIEKACENKGINLPNFVSDKHDQVKKLEHITKLAREFAQKRPR